MPRSENGRRFLCCADHRESEGEKPKIVGREHRFSPNTDSPPLGDSAGHCRGFGTVFSLTCPEGLSLSPNILLSEH